MSKTKNKKIINGIEFALFCFPALAFVLFVSDIPFLMNLYYSVFDWNGVSANMKFVGMDNFIKIFTNDRLFVQAAKFTAKYAVYYVVIVNIISLIVALAISKERKSNSIVRAFYYVPYIISLTAISLIWKFIFGPSFEAFFNISNWNFFNWSWVGTPNLVFYVIVIMTVWQNLGFYMVIYIAGIIAVPKDVLEAGRIDGATKWGLTKNITLPLIMPSVSICLLTSLTFAFKLFDIIMVFTKGGPANSTVTVAFNIYNEAFKKGNYGIATAKSLVFFAIVLVVTIIQMTITKRKEVEA